MLKYKRDIFSQYIVVCTMRLVSFGIGGRMKKYLTDNFGYTLRNIRENLKLTQKEVFQGILARSTWCNYESGIMLPDMITFITLLERMGVSSDRFEFIVPEEVHKFYEWYEECQNCIEKRDWEGLIAKRSIFQVNKQINIKVQHQCISFIDYVIERFANKNLDKAFLHIKQALTHTIYDIDDIVENTTTDHEPLKSNVS